MYVPYSDNTHGVNGIANFKVKPYNDELNMIIEMYDKSSELTMLESELNKMFIRMSSYYKIDGANSWQRLFTQKFIVMYYYKEIIEYSSYSRKRKFINRRIYMQIETKIMEQVKTVLHQFGTKYMTESGVLKRNTVINDLDKYDRDLITALLSNQLIYDEYTEKIADADVFKLNQFINMPRFKIEVQHLLY